MPVKVISERLGHESPAFTLKQYAHVLPGMQAEAAELIAAAVAGQSLQMPVRAVRPGLDRLSRQSITGANVQACDQRLGGLG